MKWMGLIIGSALGGVSRYVLAGAVIRLGGSKFPYGTFTVNLVGCFLFGFLFYVGREKFQWDQTTHHFALTGFCAAFTTFSTFIFEISELFRMGAFAKASGYLLGSIFLGLLLFYLGSLLGRLF